MASSPAQSLSIATCWSGGWPSSKWRTVEPQPGQRVIVVCTDGYQSSLAAANLQDLGVEGATDLVGGYRSLIDIEVEGG